MPSIRHAQVELLKPGSTDDPTPEWSRRIQGRQKSFLRVTKSKQKRDNGLTKRAIEIDKTKPNILVSDLRTQLESAATTAGFQASGKLIRECF